MRKSASLFAALLATVLAAPAHAVQQQGVALRWDNCFGDWGSGIKSFACDTNTGSERLVLSYTLDHDRPAVNGIEVALDVVFDSGTVPSWWQFKNSGSCRQTSLTFNSHADPSWHSCIDPAGGIETAALAAAAYGGQINDLGPSSVRIIAVVAVPPSSAFDLTAWQENFVGNLVIDHARTVGSGACGGCSIGACLDLQSVKLTAADGSTETLRDGSPWWSSKLVTWQQGGFHSYTHPRPEDCAPNDLNCIVLSDHDYFGCTLADVTPAKRTTWGAIKTLYR